MRQQVMKENGQLPDAMDGGFFVQSPRLSDQSVIPAFIIWRMRVQASQVFEEYRIVYKTVLTDVYCMIYTKSEINTD